MKRLVFGVFLGMVLVLLVSASLTDSDRVLVHHDYMSTLSAELVSVGVSKQDFRDAVNATDQWITDNSASYNSALPLPIRTLLSTRDKERLFMFVARRRFEIE